MLISRRCTRYSDYRDPIIRDYFDQMPYTYSSTLDRVVIDLEKAPANMKGFIEKNRRETAASVAAAN